MEGKTQQTAAAMAGMSGALGPQVAVRPFAVGDQD